MTLKKHGKSTSNVEVTHISRHSIWVFLDGREYLLPFASFPWFADATVAQIHHVVCVGGRRLHWPDLDVDLDVDRMAHPERYPLVAR
jgi:hypothetical protein